MAIAFLIIFAAVAGGWGIVATLAAAVSWRAFGVVTVLGGGYVAWKYASASPVASSGTPSDQLMMGVVATGFVCATLAAPVLGLLIRALLKGTRDTDRSARKAD